MIVGLGFRAKSGKDLVADYLCKQHGFKKIAFADALKEGCRSIFNLEDEQLYGDKKEVVDPFWGVTPRFILQKVGTECMRNGFSEDIWIRAAHRKILADPGDWVITDCRFPNEAEAVKSWGGKVVRIDRPEAGATGGVTKHASEVSMEKYEDWDYILENDGTIKDLFVNVDRMFVALSLRVAASKYIFDNA